MPARLPTIVRPWATTLVVLAVLAAATLAATSLDPGRASAATGCDRVVAANGSDSASGTLASPYATPQKLISSLQSGQTGCFREGTYTFAEMNVNKVGLTFAPYGSEVVTLKGSIKIPPTGAGAVIEGMKLNGAGGLSNIGPRIYADRVVLRDNEITNANTAICVTVSRYYDQPAPRGVVIERNLVHDCGAMPRTNKQHGVYLSEARETVIRDNWIYDNADRGVQMYPDAQDTTVRGNVINNNGEGVNFSGSGSSTSNGNVVKNNVIANSKDSYNAYSGSDGPVARGNVMRNNCVFASNAEDWYNDNGGIETPSRNFATSSNLTAPPRFVDPGSDDLELAPNSSCLRKYSGTLAAPDGGVPPDPDDDPGPGGHGDNGKVGIRTHDRSVHVGERFRLSGAVSADAKAPSGRVKIQQRRRGTWRPVEGARLHGRRFVQRVNAKHDGVLRLRANVKRVGHSRMIKVGVSG